MENYVLLVFGFTENWLVFIPYEVQLVGLIPKLVDACFHKDFDFFHVLGLILIPNGPKRTGMDQVNYKWVLSKKSRTSR